jgi:DNA-binding transcriptional LysR family regulator
MRPGLDPHLLQTLLAIAEARGPTAAAVQLGVNVTTVYRRIDQLESGHGAPLFERHRTGWRLLPDAAPLIAAARELERLLQRTAADLHSSQTFAHGTLRIALSEDFAACYVAPRLARFCAAHPGIQPELVVSHRFADLARGEADVAIRPHQKPGDVLVGRRVGRIAHALYAATGYVRANGRPSSLAGIAGHRVCGYGPALADYTTAQWLETGLPGAIICGRFDSTLALAAAAVGGFGIGLLPCFVAEATPSLVRVAEVPDGLPIDIWLVTAAANRTRPKVSAFLSFFAAEIKRDAKVFAA